MLESLIEFAWILGKSLLVIVPLIGVVAYYPYAERKIIGYIQVRMGPNRVGPLGLGQPIADALKLMFKEVTIPSGADKVLFIMAPILAMGAAIAAWAVVPFNDGWVVADINAGLLYILAMTSLGVYGVIIAGWASNSKYALLGGLRSAAQIVSYEIAMGFALVVVLMAAGSLNLSDIVRAQEGNVFTWFWLPLLPMFVVYLIAGVAETNRSPFDVAEGESEIVAGFHVEYSGMPFSVFFVGEYANMILISVLSAVMFVGGWLTPIPESWGWTEWAWVGGFWASGFHWFVAKVVFFMFVFLWLRATFPRYRYDQIMRLGWKVFIPLTIVWIVVVGIAIMAELPPWFDKV